MQTEQVEITPKQQSKDEKKWSAPVVEKKPAVEEKK